MKNDQISPSGRIQFNSTPIIVGAVLIGVGGMIGLGGFVVSGTAMMSATRRWFRELEVPPSEVVKQKLGQTKAATAAGASAWQQHNNGRQPAHA
jgi:hypothetical protein